LIFIFLFLLMLDNHCVISRSGCLSKAVTLQAMLLLEEGLRWQAAAILQEMLSNAKYIKV
jgi:hypothetical protein